MTNTVHGYIQITGYVNPDQLEIGVSVTVFGIGLGTFYGSFTDGIGINVDLFAVSGSVDFYVNTDSKELRVKIDLKVKFPPKELTTDVQVFSWA